MRVQGDSTSTCTISKASLVFLYLYCSLVLISWGQQDSNLHTLARNCFTDSFRSQTDLPPGGSLSLSLSAREQYGGSLSTREQYKRSLSTREQYKAAMQKTRTVPLYSSSVPRPLFLVLNSSYSKLVLELNFGCGTGIEPISPESQSSMLTIYTNHTITMVFVVHLLKIPCVFCALLQPAPSRCTDQLC